MAQHCHFCGKTPMSGHRVSHANNLTNRKWHINLKSVRTVVGGVSPAHLRLHALHPVGQGLQAQAASQSGDRRRKPRPPRRLSSRRSE